MLFYLSFFFLEYSKSSQPSPSIQRSCWARKPSHLSYLNSRLFPYPAAGCLRRFHRFCRLRNWQYIRLPELFVSIDPIVIIPQWDYQDTDYWGHRFPRIQITKDIDYREYRIPRIQIADNKAANNDKQDTGGGEDGVTGSISNSARPNASGWPVRK